MRIASDVGGTFTDLVVMDRDSVRYVKADTTPPNFEQGVMNAVAKANANLGDLDFFAHGTTVVINALLSRRGAKTALITTRGFRDVLEIARGNRPDLFNFRFRKPEPFVPRHLRHEITERVDSAGKVLTPVALEELEPMVESFKAEKVEAIAVCLLHAYVNPDHENAIVARLQALWPEVAVIASNSVCREWREYERTSTTVLSAYVLPVARTYLGKLERRTKEQGLSVPPYIMQSNGGITTVQGAAGNPITMVESGPASGMLGAAVIGQKIGENNLIALDIGGTTAKCALIHEGAVKVTTDYRIEWNRTSPGYPIRTPVVDLVEIGNGGGSIAWVDDGGRMHVGPQSAGAMPGPAAYGRGGKDVTTTDANLTLGRINPDLFLGGETRPDEQSLAAAFAELSDKTGHDRTEIAKGVIRIANANMVNALKLVSLNKGYDPRDFALIAFGGGGSMHAVDLAEDLGARKVIIPVNASVFSAWGMLMSDLRRDFIQTHVMPLDDSLLDSVHAAYQGLEAEAEEVCVAEGMPADRLICHRHADLRYLGQEHTVKIAMPEGGLTPDKLAQTIEEFHVAHEREYSFRLTNPVELVNLHLVVTAEIDDKLIPERPVTGRDIADVVTGHRRVDFDLNGIHDATIYDLRLLEPGMDFTGPAIIEDPTTTIVVSPDKHVSMDKYGNIHIQLEKHHG